MSDQVNTNEIQEQLECCVCLEPAEVKAQTPCNHPEPIWEGCFQKLICRAYFKGKIAKCPLCRTEWRPEPESDSESEPESEPESDSVDDNELDDDEISFVYVKYQYKYGNPKVWASLEPPVVMINIPNSKNETNILFLFREKIIFKEHRKVVAVHLEWRKYNR